MVTSAGSTPTVSAGVRNVRAAARSRLTDSHTSMTCPYWSTARYRYIHRPLTFTYVSSTNQAITRHVPPRAGRLDELRREPLHPPIDGDVIDVHTMLGE